MPLTRRRGMKLMDKPDNNNGKQFHITLNSYDRAALDHMRVHYGTSRSGAIRACIRAAAQQIGFRSPHHPTESE
jgi:hypothetical protein